MSNENNVANGTDEMVATASEGNGSKVFPLIPEGVHQLVCVGVKDFGWHDGFDASKPKVRKFAYVFESKTEITREDIVEAAQRAGVEPTDKDFERVGKRFTVMSPRLNLKLSYPDQDMQSGLTKFVNVWRGKALTSDEVKAGHAPASQIGVNGKAMISNAEAKDDATKVYANIVSLKPWVGDLIESRDYKAKAKAANANA